MQLALGIVLIVMMAPPGVSQEPIPQFSDRTDDAGLTVVTYSGGVDKNHILESTGNGVLAFDYDLDGDQDLYFVNAFKLSVRGETETNTNVLYRNNGDGTFHDVTAAAGVGAAFYGHGGCIGDVDGDGLPDVYVTNYGPNILYRNNGDGTFTDITEQAGVGDPRYSIGASFFDADGDGDQDLFVSNYLEATWEEVHAARRTRRWRGMVEVLDGPKGLVGSPNTFYRNDGQGIFTEATKEAGFASGGEIYGMGVATFDFDNDGDIDVYVVGDSSPNRLYQNRGDGTFDEIGTRTGSGYSTDGNTQGSMGVHFGDYDSDGWQDLIVTNFANDYYTLYHNLNGQIFIDNSFAAGLAVPTFVPLGWVALFFDADHDRDLDLFFSNGHIYPQVDNDPNLHESYKQTNQLFVNQNGKYTEVSEQAGEVFAITESSRGGACADLDNDGDLDIVVSNQDAKPTFYENRTESSNHWVMVQLADIQGPAQALGARVELRIGEHVQMREIASGAGYASQNDFRLHFGLGKAETIDELSVRWPDGTRESVLEVPANQHYLWKRGQVPFPLGTSSRKP